MPMASAIRLSNNNNYKVEDANHLTICKPPTKDHPSYSILLEHLKTFMKVNNIDFTSWNFVCSFYYDIISYHVICMPYLLRLYYPLFKITNYLFMNFDRNKTQDLCHLCHVMKWHWKIKQTL